MSDFIKNIFYKQREDFKETSHKRHEEMTFPDDVFEYTDIPYANDGCDAHRLDVFRPKDRNDEVLPVIINVHGGGLIIGDKEFNRYFCANLCKKGFVVFSIEYRLIPDCMIFDQFYDVSLAMNCIKELLGKYNGDIHHVYAAGDSGGACLLAYSLAIQNNPSMADAANITPSDLEIKAAGFISGMFYTNRLDKIGMFLPKYLYGNDYKKGKFAPYINPENHEMVRSLPPCFLVTSHNDFLCKYTLDFEEALTLDGIKHELLNYPKNPKLTHAFSVFYPDLPESTDTINKMTAFFTANR